MKKKLSLFCTEWYMYLCELPVIYLLYLCIKHNEAVDVPVKLYPLIIALIGCAVFMFVYLYRIIEVSYSEIKSVGPYSSKEKALVNEGKTLTLTLLSRGRVRVELSGVDEQPPALDWAKSEDYENLEVNLFRDRAVGGKSTAKRTLKFFNVPSEDIAAALSEERFVKSYELIDLSSEHREDIREIKIKFTKTV